MRVLIPNRTDTDHGPEWSQDSVANLVVTASRAERSGLA
jgi:hypothetical protein